jgi:DNA-binding winged helix-turn-helix (wHTH) protein
MLASIQAGDSHNRRRPCLDDIEPCPYEFDDVRVDAALRLVSKAGRPVRLTARRFDLLLLLIRNRHRVLSRAELLAALWPDLIVEEGNLTVHVSALRKALGDRARQPRYICTLSRYGYRFLAEIRSDCQRTLPSMFDARRASSGSFCDNVGDERLP